MKENYMLREYAGVEEESAADVRLQGELEELYAGAEEEAVADARLQEYAGVGEEASADVKLQGESAQHVGKSFQRSVSY